MPYVKLAVSSSAADVTQKGSSDGAAHVVMPGGNAVLATGSIAFTGTANLTTEIKTSAITPAATVNAQDTCAVLIDRKTALGTAGALTVNLYNVCTFGATACDVPHYSFNMGTAMYAIKLVSGLFVGDGTSKIGMKFATDSTGITPRYVIRKA